MKIDPESLAAALQRIITTPPRRPPAPRNAAEREKMARILACHPNAFSRGEPIILDMVQPNVKPRGK